MHILYKSNISEEEDRCLNAVFVCLNPYLRHNDVDI